jgi:Putative adhesin
VTARISRRNLKGPFGGFLAVSVAAVLIVAVSASARRQPAPPYATHPDNRLTSDLTGSVPTHEGDHVRVKTDLGSINIRTQSSDKSGTVAYHVHLETDASQKDAAELLKSFTISARATAEGVLLKAEGPERRGAGRLWVTLDLQIPKNSSVDVSTGGGNIDSGSIEGRVGLSTSGGNITAENIGGAAHLDTGGGNIVAKDVAGELYATTGGGHITIGSVAGNATLHTGGGHIRVASVQGTAHFDTGGGNITLEHSGAELTAETGGGEIEVGEAAGLVRARTSGGGIRVVRTFGPTDLETSGGSIYLTQVDSAVKASTSDGGITAWFVTPTKTAGTCELESSSGDITVHLPRELPVTIDALVMKGGDHRVIVDPAFPLKVSYDDSLKGAHIVRAEGDLNGGGELLRLRTVAGNIRFVLSDASTQLEMTRQQMLQLQQQMEHSQQGWQHKMEKFSQPPSGSSEDSH